MIIPKDLFLREQFYAEVVKNCLSSLEEREMNYAMLRNFYLYGSDLSQGSSPHNKIFPSIDLLSSFLFASETTKFSVQIGESVPEAEYAKIPTANRVINREWHDSNADLVFSNAINWALVFNSTFVKLIWKNGCLNPFFIEPACIGVLREDLPFTDRQEAIVHTYYTTKSRLALDIASHPQRQAILDRINARQIDVDKTPTGLQRLILSASSPNMVGNAPTFQGQAKSMYSPTVTEELVEMQELWVWDDEENDYRVVTTADRDVVIYDRKNFWLPGELNIVQVCPNPLYSYYWGLSEVAGLTDLQAWRNERIAQIRDLLNKQVEPPTALMGWMGLLDEKNFALNRSGGVLSSQEPMGKVERFAPNIPADIFSEIREIDEMFSERTGMQNILQGKGEVGVRSGRQTSELARLGSSRVKRKALVIEDSLEKLATLYLKALRAYDKRAYKDENGNKFILEQFPSDFIVKVDAHSNSPIFVEDQKNMAAELFKAGAIDRESLIDMIDPPMKDLLQKKLKVIIKKEEEAQKAQAQSEQAAAQAKPPAKKG